MGAAAAKMAPGADGEEAFWQMHLRRRVVVTLAEDQRPITGVLDWYGKYTIGLRLPDDSVPVLLYKHALVSVRRALGK